MSGSPFDRRILNQRERPLSSDLNTEFSEIDRTVRAFIETQSRALIDGVTGVGFVPARGFLWDGFMAQPAAVPAMQVVVPAGLGFQQNLADVPVAIDGILGVDDLSAFKPLLLLNDQTINVPAADAVNPRIDLIQIKYDRLITDAASRDVLDPGTGVFTPTLVNKTLTWLLDGNVAVRTPPYPAVSAAIDYKVGVAAGAPAPPAVDAGYVSLAQVQVPALLAAITREHIKDMRYMIAPGGSIRFGGEFILPNGAGGAPTGLHHDAPPGVRLVITHDGAGLATLYVLGPENMASGTISVFGGQDVATSGLSLAWCGPRSIGQVTGAMKTAIEGATAVPAGVLVPKDLGTGTGHRVVSGIFTVGERNVGTGVIDVPITAPRQFHFQVEIYLVP